MTFLRTPEVVFSVHIFIIKNYPTYQHDLQAIKSSKPTEASAMLMFYFMVLLIESVNAWKSETLFWNDNWLIIIQ